MSNASTETSKEVDCPVCEGKGWFVVPHRNTGDASQQQCEWCTGTGKLPFQQAELLRE